MRLNQYIARAGVCSRREADRLIESGRVLLNGKMAITGMKVEATDSVMVDGIAISVNDRIIILAYNKPVGVTCSERDPHAKRIVTDEIKYPERVTYAGRLDRESEGLLLLSNDGAFIQRFMKPENAHEREYEVELREDYTEGFLNDMGQGVYLEELDIKTRKCSLYRIDNRRFGIVLTQGVNRQIRRMCQAFGHEVMKLKRIRIETVHLGALKPGEWRELNDDEIKELMGNER